MCWRGSSGLRGAESAPVDAPAGFPSPDRRCRHPSPAILPKPIARTQREAQRSCDYRRMSAQHGGPRPHRRRRWLLHRIASRMPCPRLRQGHRHRSWPGHLERLRGPRAAGRPDQCRACLCGRPDDPALPAGAVDVALLVRMYHEIEQPYAFMWRLREALKQACLQFQRSRTRDAESLARRPVCSPVRSRPLAMKRAAHRISDADRLCRDVCRAGNVARPAVRRETLQSCPAEPQPHRRAIAEPLRSYRVATCPGQGSRQSSARSASQVKRARRA